MFYNAGQMCIGAKRVYIHADIYESMRDRLVAIASGINIGDGLNPETHIGPLQNAAQYQKVKYASTIFT
jgi:acyl-CoA reductase-like NAD-dependent aldehyde dehydrogenase